MAGLTLVPLLTQSSRSHSKPLSEPFAGGRPLKTLNITQRGSLWLSDTSEFLRHVTLG